MLKIFILGGIVHSMDNIVVLIINGNGSLSKSLYEHIKFFLEIVDNSLFLGARLEDFYASCDFLSVLLNKIIFGVFSKLTSTPIASQLFLSFY